MPAVSAQTTKSILRDVVARDAILLRGSESILAGEEQNDIDIFIPKCSWDSATAFGPHEAKSCERAGLEQWKVQVREAHSNEIAEVDVFHQVSWRGLLLADIRKVPTQISDGLGIRCLQRNAEVWLTVLKNVIHASPTPPNKIKDVEGSPTFSILTGLPGALRNRLQQSLAQTVWDAARRPKPDRRSVLAARSLFVLIRLLESPLGTPQVMLRWIVWRVGRRFTR